MKPQLRPQSVTGSLEKNGVIECTAQQINDMVFETWQLVLIIVGKGRLLHIVCKHLYDLMKWSQFSHSAAKPLKKNGLIYTSFLLHKSISKENYIERRVGPRGATPINVVIFHVWIVLNLRWPQTSQKSVVCPVLSFLRVLSHSLIFPATVFLSALHQQLFNALIFQGLKSISLGEQHWHVLVFPAKQTA